MPTSIRRRPMAGAFAAVAAALCLGATASAASAQTLVGETFANAVHSEAITWEGTCNPSGPSTFTFGVFGNASGPVPGQFSEYGQLTLASPSGPVTSFDSEFTIMEGETTWVPGTRTLAESVSAACQAPSGFGSSDVSFEVKAGYDVLDPFAESGPSTVKLNTGINGESGFTAVFGEQTPPPPPPPAEEPRSKDDCKSGGWERYGFKNQGECVSSVTKRGRG